MQLIFLDLEEVLVLLTKYLNIIAMNLDFKGNSPDEAEEYFMHSLENWRKAMNLRKFHLLGLKTYIKIYSLCEGHSFGGYLSSVYALRHPERVHNLILADP